MTSKTATFPAKIIGIFQHGIPCFHVTVAAATEAAQHNGETCYYEVGINAFVKCILVLLKKQGAL